MMGGAVESSLDELSAANARRAALAYVSETFAEALPDNIDADAFAEAALGAAMRDLVAVHGEDYAAAMASRLADCVVAGNSPR